MSTPPDGPPPYDPNQPPPPPGGGQVPPPPGGGQVPPPPGGGQPPYDSGQGGGYGYPPAPPGGYASGGGGSASGNNTLAIASLVLGILGLPFAFCCGLGIVMSAPAIVTGWMGKKKADQGQAGQRGLALTGLILGVIGTLIALLFLILWIVAIATGEEFNYQYGTDFE